MQDWMPVVKFKPRTHNGSRYKDWESVHVLTDESFVCVRVTRFSHVQPETLIELFKESFSQKFNFGLSECHKKSVVTLVEHFGGE